MHTNRRDFIRTAALSGLSMSLLANEAFSSIGQPAKSIQVACLTSSDPDGLIKGLSERYKAIVPYSDQAFQALLQRDDIDAIVVDVSPALRMPIALAAMKAGKPTAFTKPAAQSVGAVQTLLAMYRQTGTPCLLLDNELFTRDALAISTMVRQQQFGDLTHVACGTDSPTNGLGPAMHWLGINRGNRFVSLTASVSQSWGLHEPILSGPATKNEPIVKQYQLGEVMTINLQCKNGQTVTISRDLTGKRPHSRGYRLQGVNGLWMEDNDTLIRNGQQDLFSAARSRFDHPFWQQNQPKSLPEPDALGWLISALQTQTLTPENTFDALTIPLVQAIAKSSVDIWNDTINIPDWFTHPYS